MTLKLESVGNMKKILLVTSEREATDRLCWSGIPFSMLNELKKYYEVDTYAIGIFCSPIALIRAILYRYVLRQFSGVRNTRQWAKKASILLQKKINAQEYDCIIIFDQSTIGALAYLNTDIPVMIYADSVIALLQDYYFSLPREMLEETIRMQEIGIKKASKIVLASNWAKKYIEKEYQVKEENTGIVHLGANIENPNNYYYREHEGIKLLFIGIDGVRKGVDIAIDCVKHLNMIDTHNRYHLDIVGCQPNVNDENITVHGFLNRNDPIQRNKMEQIRATGDFFILPTHAEAAGQVFCEAGAYSIPSISYDTGGVSDYVIDGENGVLLPPSANGKDFAEAILKILREDGKLEYLKKRSHELYEEEYNWKVAGRAFANAIDEIIL